MKKLMLSLSFTIFIVGSTLGIECRLTDRIYCLNQDGIACNVPRPYLSLVDRGFGISGIQQCSPVPTIFPCPAVAIYIGL